MSNLGLQKQDYNFFSTELDSKRSSRRKGIVYFVLILLYILLLAGAFFLLQYVIGTAQKQTDTLDTYLASEEITAQRKLASDKRNEIRSMQQYDASLQVFAQNLQRISIVGTEYVKQITTAIPQGLYFENVSMTANQLQIQGNVPNRQIIAEYIHNMQALDLFQDVHISTITTVSETDEESQTTASLYTFVMSCQLKDVIEE